MPSSYSHCMFLIPLYMSFLIKQTNPPESLLAFFLLVRCLHIGSENPSIFKILLTFVQLSEKKIISKFLNSLTKSSFSNFSSSPPYTFKEQTDNTFLTESLFTKRILSPGSSSYFLAYLVTSSSFSSFPSQIRRAGHTIEQFLPLSLSSFSCGMRVSRAFLTS